VFNSRALLNLERGLDYRRDLDKELKKGFREWI